MLDEVLPMEEMEQNEDEDNECLCEDEEDCRLWLRWYPLPMGGSGCVHDGGAGRTKDFWPGLETRDRIMEARSAFMAAGS